MSPRGKKRSFFERLTGSVDVDEYDEFDQPHGGYDAQYEHEAYSHQAPAPEPVYEQPYPEPEGHWIEEEQEGQLTVDVYQTADEIVIKSIVAGVNPSDLDVSITRDMVTIRGKRDEAQEVSDEDYFHQELYWGAFSRSILLPAEIEVEEAKASEKHGLLTIRLPKVDKEKQTKLKVKMD
ncbi:Hsp20 family protein [Patescibacteria group bacterium]|jgi:HSP20 family protein|nr:Hsp20 family protein [Patescibacteria group bacterium]